MSVNGKASRVFSSVHRKTLICGDKALTLPPDNNKNTEDKSNIPATHCASSKPMPWPLTASGFTPQSLSHATIAHCAVNTSASARWRSFSFNCVYIFSHCLIDCSIRGSYCAKLFVCSTGKLSQKLIANRPAPPFATRSINTSG